MKILFAISSVFYLLGCGENQVRQLAMSNSHNLELRLKQSETHCRLANEDLDIGAYLSKTPDKQLVSVVRDQEAPQHGLVQIDPVSLRLTLLDESATEAAEIKLSDEFIAYRNKESVWLLANGKPEELLNSGVSRLMAFDQTSESTTLQIENTSGGFDWICFDQNHLVSGGASSEDFVLSLAHDPHGRQWIVLESTDGIYLQRASLCTDSNLITYRPKHKFRTDHAKLVVTDKEAFISYLNRENGNFELLIFNLESELWTHETIDGIAYQNYLGMDIDAQIVAPFERPIYLYLDAWKLEPKLAIYSLGKWTTSHIGIGGSSGFYNQILSTKNNIMKIAFRSFRNEMSTGRSSFENLVLCEIDFQPMVDTKNVPDTSR
ncbi:MAG: hypothetical protein COV44_08245 [Deltaproteobacteria bacterium CG11_big_fil_rev_8_21_14_0_20_45_16]|nr:MAG: hypothetical protein COV44_08245 [Deltaproteobacteria bacterium CG11_big_fil_rev_8_21_14_0_20_45_16]